MISFEHDKIQTYADSLGLSKEEIEKLGLNLYHGIRFDSIKKLESIFKTGSILCGRKINQSFESYDGTTKYLYVDSFDSENCNMGKYISVMPYINDLEFDTFVRENLFFAIKGSIDAFETIHLSYDEYCEIKEKDKNNNLYSYAHNEYFVKDEISLNDVLYIGIDSKYYNGDYNKTVNDVIELIKAYKIDIPFVDIQKREEIFCYNKNLDNKNKVI